MTDRPTGWVETTLGEVCEIVGGSTPKTGVAEYWGGEIAWLTPDDLSRRRGKLIDRGARSLTRAGYDSCSARLMPPGSVLFTSRAPIGYVAIATDAICTNQGFKSFIPPEGLLADYLYWYLRHATPMIRDMGSGTTFREVSKKVVATVTLLLPPTREQRRIVEAIEEQLSRLDQACMLLHAVVPRLKQLRKATLHEVLMGAWPTTKVGAVADVDSGPAFKSQYFRDEGQGIRLLRGENIEPGRLRWEQVRTWPEERLSGFEHLHVAESDVILAMDRPVISTGLKLARVQPDDLPALLVQRVARIRPSSELFAEFLYLALQHPAFVRHLLGGQTGTQLPHITLQGIRDFSIPLPSLGDQQAVVAVAARQLSLIESQEASLRAALARANTLQRAILNRAFHGTLVPQDPSDEPASVLLERIAQKRASDQPKRPRKAAARRAPKG